MGERANVTLQGRHKGGVTRVLAVGDDVYSAGCDGRICRSSAGQPAKELLRFERIHVFPKEPLSQPFAAWFDIADGVLACAMKHGVVRLFEAASGESGRTFKNPPVGSAYALDFDSIAFNPANPHEVAASNGRYVNVWNSKTGKLLWQDTQSSRANGVGFCRDGQYLLIQEWDPLVRVIHWPNPTLAPFRFAMVQSSLNLVALRPCRNAAHFDFAVSAVDADGAFILAMKLEREKPIFKGKTTQRIHDLDIFADGRHILTGGDDGILRIFDSRSKKVRDIDLTQSEVVASLSTDEAPSGPGVLCTKEVDDEYYGPHAIHAVAMGPSDAWAAVGLVGGLVLRVDL